MSTLTWFTMIAVLLIVWGGFTLCLSTALRREKGKQDREPHP